MRRSCLRLCRPPGPEVAQGALQAIAAFQGSRHHEDLGPREVTIADETMPLESAHERNCGLLEREDHARRGDLPEPGLKQGATVLQLAGAQAVGAGGRALD